MILKKKRWMQPNNPLVEGVKYNNTCIRITYIILTVLPILYSFLLIFLKISNPFDYCVCAVLIFVNLILTKYVFSKKLIGIKWSTNCKKIDYTFPDDNSSLDPRDSSAFTWTLILPLPYWFVASFFVGHHTEFLYFCIYFVLFILQGFHSLILLRGYNTASKKWEETAKTAILGDADRFKELPEKFTIDNPEGEEN